MTDNEKVMNGDRTMPSTDIAIAKHLFERIETMGNSDLPGLKVWKKTLGCFNGDITLCALRPSGGIHILLGDFIPSGLSTVVAALPIAEVFYGMTEKGFGLSDIIEEINKKLLFILPEGVFGSACLIELDRERKLLTVWNGGMPDVLVIDAESKIKHRISSTHIPLGLDNAKTADLETVFVEVSAGDVLFWCSDGAVNAENQQGVKFGQDEIARLLTQDSDLSILTNAIHAHVADADLVDDITLAQLDISALQNNDVISVPSSTEVSMPPAEWHVDFSFPAAILREVDLAPLLVNVLIQIQAPHEHRQRIYTVLAEMCSNALEHGVLGLKSSMKGSANGFTEFYALRSQRLAELEDAYINITMRHEPVETGGQLTISVEDSGPGFDYQKHGKDLAENTAFSGRGEALINQLCDQYYYSGNGNCAHAVYLWSITS